MKVPGVTPPTVRESTQRFLAAGFAFSCQRSMATKVRKHLSRSNSELEISSSRRRKPCGTARTADGFCSGDIACGSGQGAPVLPSGLLSCLSMLELSKLDSDSLSEAGHGTGNATAAPCNSYHRRVPSRSGSMQRIGSAGTLKEILSRIRVPSQRAAMAEMAAAAERIEAQRASPSCSSSWCELPARAASSAAQSPSTGFFSAPLTSSLELDEIQLGAVLRPPPALSQWAKASSSVFGIAVGAADDAEPRASIDLPVIGALTDAPEGRRICSDSLQPMFSAQTATCSTVAARPHGTARRSSVHAAAAAALPDGTLVAACACNVDVAATASVSSPSPLQLPHAARACSPCLVPTAFQWVDGGRAFAAVYLCGTFNNWAERLPMRRRAGRCGEEWWLVLNLPPGEYAYKFVVQGPDGRIEWQHAPDQPSLVDALGHTNNWTSVVDQFDYEQEGSGSQIIEDEEEGFSQVVPAEFAEMLFATEPPSVPTFLIGRADEPTTLASIDGHEEADSCCSSTHTPPCSLWPLPRAGPTLDVAGADVALPSEQHKMRTILGQSPRALLSPLLLPASGPTEPKTARHDSAKHHLPPPLVHSTLSHVLVMSTNNDAQDSWCQGSAKSTPSISGSSTQVDVFEAPSLSAADDCLKSSPSCESSTESLAPTASRILDSARARSLASLRLPSPVVIRTTVRCRHKFITIEFVRSGGEPFASRPLRNL